MHVSKTTYLVFVVVATIMTLSVTVFRGEKGSASTQQDVRRTAVPIYERDERYPVVDSNEPEPSDPVKKAKLKKQQQRYDKDAGGPKEADNASVNYVYCSPPCPQFCDLDSCGLNCVSADPCTASTLDAGLGMCFL
jgi:hypothetical protein